MAIADKLTKLEADIRASYDKVTEKGGVVPVNQNTNNLPDAIDSITAQGTIVSKTIDANGTYNASTDNADGYNPVVVQVPKLDKMPTYKNYTDAVNHAFTVGSAATLGAECFIPKTNSGKNASYENLYFFKRDSNTNIYFNIGQFSNSTIWNMGHRYRILFYAWSAGDVDNKPIKFWQGVFFFNNATVPMNVTEVGRTPTLIDVTFTYNGTQTSYRNQVYIYPEGSNNKFCFTAPIAYDLDSTAGYATYGNGNSNIIFYNKAGQ